MGSIIYIAGCIGSLLFIGLVIAVIYFLFIKKKEKPGEITETTKELPGQEQQEEISPQVEAQVEAEIHEEESAAEEEYIATEQGEAVSEEPLEEEQSVGVEAGAEEEETSTEEEIWGTLIIDDAPDGTIIGSEYQIVGTVVIGRSPDVEISCTFDKAMSRKHTEIFMGPEGYPMLRDLGSSNGTIVNDAEIEGAIPLEEDMVILLGETTFTWKSAG